MAQNLLSMSNLSQSEKSQLLQLLKSKVSRIERNRLQTWFNTPEIRKGYRKQIEFFSAGKEYRERALFGGNRTGKTHCGCFEDAVHLTGRYPKWWPGRKFEHPVDWWVATDIGKNTRDILQEKLCGKPGVAGSLGTGMIPADLIVDYTTKHGLSNAYETLFITHEPTGGVSTLQFKSYDQGREAFQGTHQDGIHLDEEPPISVYTECLLRIMATGQDEYEGGMLILTETPLLGVTELMVTYMPELNPEPDMMPPPDLWEEEEITEEAPLEE